MPTPLTIICPHCEQGTRWTSRYGGNDPDVWRVGPCETCDATGIVTLLCDRAGQGGEHEIAQKIRARAPHAQPNRLLVRLADQSLDRGGQMVRAVEAMGPGKLVDEGVPVELPLTIFGL